jgi:uncharacterized integral membrane protein
MRRGDDLGPQDREGNLEGREGLEGREPPPPPSRSGITPRQILIGILAILLIAFAIANFEPVEVSFLLFDSRARVVTVIAVAGVLGFVIGYFVGRPGREERRRLRERDRD